MSQVPIMENLKKLPNRESHTCFGCGRSNTSGLRMEFYTDGGSVYSWLAIPAHLCGWDDVVHGGVVSTVMDEIMSWASMCLLRRYIMTRSITVDFLKPLHTGKKIRAEGRIREKVSDREAVMEGFIYDDAENLCARSTGRFALFTSEGIKKIGLLDMRLLEDLDEIFKV
jgi:uncharacterized protein (TIGR00369 family)